MLCYVITRQSNGEMSIKNCVRDRKRAFVFSLPYDSVTYLTAPNYIIL